MLAKSKDLFEQIGASVQTEKAIALMGEASCSGNPDNS